MGEHGYDVLRLRNNHCIGLPLDSPPLCGISPFRGTTGRHRMCATSGLHKAETRTTNDRLIHGRTRRVPVRRWHLHLTLAHAPLLRRYDLEAGVTSRAVARS